MSEPDGYHYDVFISYNRAEEAWVQRELLPRLQAAGISFIDFELGRPELDERERAVKESRWTLLVLTPHYLGDTWRQFDSLLSATYGLDIGAWRTIPLILLDCDLPVRLRALTSLDLRHPTEASWQRLMRKLSSRPVPPEPSKTARALAPFMAEDLPDDYVARPDEFERLIAALLDRRSDTPVAITAALRGAGGYGKTTLAKALCHDLRVRDAFADGVLWVTLGERPGDLTARLEDLIETLSGERPGFAGVEAATARLAETLADRDILLMIDDVWSALDLRPFTRGGPRCARLITTRDSATLPSSSKTVDVDAMQQDEAADLLGAGLPAADPAALRALAARLGEWPLLLKLVNGALREQVGMGLSAGEALAYINEALDELGLTAFDAQVPAERSQAGRRNPRRQPTAVERRRSRSLRRVSDLPPRRGHPVRHVGEAVGYDRRTQALPCQTALSAAVPPVAAAGL